MVLLVGCVEKVPSTPNPVTKLEAIESLSDFAVPTRAGYTTTVSLNGEVLAQTASPMTISVPRYAQEENSLEVSYTLGDIYDGFSSASYWQYLSFEDSRSADYDFNDVVLHCRVVTEKPWAVTGEQLYVHTISVQPIALGGTKKLKLGILYRPDPTKEELAEKILCEDIRAELFSGIASFPINTDPSNIRKVTSKLKELFEVKNSDPQCKVVWFIEGESERLYAATTNFNVQKGLDMISQTGMPYGIALTRTWNYPVEKCHIWDAYPNFRAWLASGDERVLLEKSVKENVFPAKLPNSIGEDLWQWKP